MSQFSTALLLQTKTVAIRDIVCDGGCRHKGDEECAHKTSLVYPYRGVFMRHVGRNDTVAEANQMLFFNADQGYRISHPIEGGDACVDLAIDETMLEELAPKDQVQRGAAFSFRRQRRRIDPRAQALVALLRHGLRRNVAETLEAETLALTLVRRSLGERTSHAAGASAGRQKLVDRAKLCFPPISPGAGHFRKSPPKSASRLFISPRSSSRSRRRRFTAISCGSGSPAHSICSASMKI
ncbi:hypothetical protein FHX03_006865 [Rhizobium sp. BK456]|nr:hypothetical protein [Rhizobium sp. BK456]